jgi:hypothetical protein
VDECKSLVAGRGKEAARRGAPGPQGRGVIDNKHSTDIGAWLTFSVNAHTYVRTPFVDSPLFEYLFSIGRFRYIASRA